MTHPALSIRQPWAAAIIHLGKDVENRTWPMPEKYIGKPLLLHAGKAKPRPDEWSGHLFDWSMKAHELYYGGIIGKIVFGRSIQNSPSMWAESGLWHWPILEVTPMPFVPCRGQLGFFKVVTL